MMTAETLRRVCQWEGCNAVYNAPLTGWSEYCPQHQRINNYEPKPAHTKRVMPPKNPWTVVRSPSGDFVGVTFSQLDFYATVWMGSFDPGTVARHDGLLYIVDGCNLRRFGRLWTVVMAGASPYLKQLEG